MTERHTSLKTKIKELESTLNDPLLRGPDEHSEEDTKQKLAFIRKLLGAEVTSNPSKPHQLQHMSERVSLIENTFHEWDTQRRRMFSGEFDKYSCDDGEALDETDLIVIDDPKKLFPDFVDKEKAIVEFRGNVCEEVGEKVSFFEDDEDDFYEEIVKKRKDDGSGKKYCCVMGGGVVIGMILMGFIMVTFSGCFDYVDQQVSFAFPS